MNATVTTVRIMPPHTARPVAVAAGLRFSTASVKLAIQAQYVMPAPTEITTSTSANV
jgi:hypothetical protein